MASGLQHGSAPQLSGIPDAGAGCQGRGGLSGRTRIIIGPNLGGRSRGIESKFGEPFETSKPNVVFKDKYFPAGQPLWTEYGLTKCGILANRIKNCEVAFRYVDAAQLLKHALGLQVNHPNHFTLCYIYFDSEDHPEAIQHRAEINEFESVIAGDFRFVVLSYRTLIQRLRGLSEPAHNAYFEYIGERYGV